ncbi:MAG: tetratricopeptide repeat protein [Spirochaetales bacterium]|nr:tetratricopeptide repeat protein [Spirochaetales bacterium]
MNRLKAVLWERFGLNAYIAGDYQRAERWFRKLEGHEPDSLRVLRNLGLIMLALGKKEEAERYLLKEEKLYGPSFHRHAALADLAYALGRRKEAERRYRKALAEPECAEGGSASELRWLIEQRIEICADPHRYERSRKAMELFFEAERVRDAGEYEKAIELFNASFAEDGTNWPALNNAGSILFNRLGKPAEAKPYFERAFRIARSIQVARNLELCRKALGEKDV